MRHITVSRRIDAARDAVWSVLADFPNIADWNSGIASSHATCEIHEGVGATRHCDLKPVGKLEETVAEWVDGERMVVRIDSAARLPIRTGLVTFSLSDSTDGGSGATTVNVDYDFSVKPRFMAPVVGRMVESQLTKGFNGFLADLDAAATNTTTHP